MASASANIGRNTSGIMLDSNHSCCPVNAAHPPSLVISGMGDALGGRKARAARRPANTKTPLSLQASIAKRMMCFVLF